VSQLSWQEGLPSIPLDAVKVDATLKRPPDLRLFLTSVARSHVPPHPMWRVFKAAVNAIDCCCRFYKRVMLAYLLVVLTIAARWAIIAHQ
jgi:hypothetical protein